MDTSIKFTQKGNTCGVYSLAYALDKLDIRKLSIDNERELLEWARKVTIIEGNIDSGCDPVKLTEFILSQFPGLLNARLYATVDDLIGQLKSEGMAKMVLETLKKEAETLIRGNYMPLRYDYSSLKENEICLGVFVKDVYNKTKVIEAFLKALANPASLHYMMIKKDESTYCVFDSNVGLNKSFNIEDDIVAIEYDKENICYTYTGIAIVLTKK